MSEIDDLLAFDPLAEAERIAGRDEPGALALGMLLNTAHAERKRDELGLRGDTYWSMPFLDAVDAFRDAGFEVASARRFAGHQDVAETLLVLWHPDGILGRLESYKGTDTNAANIYYNLRFHTGCDPTERWRATSSGGCVGPDDDPVWVGDHDVREALHHKLARLRAVADFVTPWVQAPLYYLGCYADERRAAGERFSVTWRRMDAVTQAALERLPEQVRSAVGAFRTYEDVMGVE